MNLTLETTKYTKYTKIRLSFCHPLEERILMNVSHPPCWRVVLILAGFASITLAQAPDPLKFHVDKSLFPKAYGVLASEHLMYPIDQGDWPVKIDHTRQLFLDDYLIAELQNVKRTINQAKKHPANPLIDRDKPWEGRGPVFHVIVKDEESQKFRMWYCGYLNYTLPSGTMVRWPTCYAESDDGIHWTKPQLGLHDFEGSKANNIVIPKGGIFGLMHEPDDPDPGRQYKAVVWHDWKDPRGAPPEGFYLYVSPDGIHWTQARKAPLAISQNSHQTGIGDTSLFSWDHRLGRYVCYTKILLRAPTRRTSGMMESDDLIHWSRPRMTIFPDGLDASDTQIYEHLGFAYESMWIGLVRIYHRDLVENSRKQTVVELTASRDGRHWTRVGDRKILVPLGKPDEWDPHYHAPTSPPILMGDKIGIYYFSMPLWDFELVGEEAGRNSTARIGLATIRRDGFVSLDGGSEPGHVVTRPLTFSGKKLFVNAEISPGGHLKAELRNTAGDALPQYQLKHCHSVQGDVMSAPVTWAEAKELHRPEGESLRLVFELKNAKLYSFWIE